jgi:hypothetical protein
MPQLHSSGEEGGHADRPPSVVAAKNRRKALSCQPRQGAHGRLHIPPAGDDRLAAAGLRRRRAVVHKSLAINERHSSRLWPPKWATRRLAFLTVAWMWSSGLKALTSLGTGAYKTRAGRPKTRRCVGSSERGGRPLARGGREDVERTGPETLRRGFTSLYRPGSGESECQINKGFIWTFVQVGCRIKRIVCC